MNYFFFWSDRIIRFCLYALMLSIPFGNAPVEIFANAAIGFFVIEAIIKLIKGDRSFFRVGGDLFIWSIWVFVFWNIVSVIFSTNVVQSAEAFISKLMEGVLLLFVISSHIKTKKQLGRLLTCFFLGAFVVSINGIFQWFSGQDFIRGTQTFIQHDGRRINGGFKHPNGFAGYLITVIPLLLSLVFIPQSWLKKGKTAIKTIISFFTPRTRLYLILLLLLTLTCLGLTFSRGAWVGLFGGLIFLILYKKKLRVFVLAILVVFIITFLPLLFQNRAAALSDPQSLFGGLSTFFSNTSGRHQFWHDALVIARDHPFTGSGLNTYSDTIKTYPQAFQGFYAHNCYLQMAAELGFVGMGFFLTMIFLFFGKFFREIVKVQDQLLRSIEWGIGAALFAFLIHAFFDTILYGVQLGKMHWIFMGLTLAIFKINEGKIRSDK